MKIIINKNWQHISQHYQWAADMHNVPQNPVHHREGDVATHTQMVLLALSRLSEYKLLPEPAREILWMAALLHDVEKRSTTFTDTDGNIVSPGHAKKGALTARQILFKEFDVSFHTREEIVALVRYHGLPLWLMHKPDPQKALLEASLEVNTAWLAILARADVLGRICDDQSELLDRIDYFEAYCEEQQCYGKPYHFVSDLAKFKYFHSDEGNANYDPYDNTICEVTIMSGLPGMGKDHFIKQHLKDLPMISPDALRRQNRIKPDDKSKDGWIVQQAKEQARVYLRAHQNFVWNATNITLQMRSQLITLLADYNARIKILYVEQPYALWRKQNLMREDIGMVPEKIQEKLLGKLEVPKQSEAHQVKYIVAQ